MGESITWGYTASSKEKCWVNLVAEMLEACQGSPIELLNQGVGSNVLTPLCPAYGLSARPSAIERVENGLIALRPDFVLLAYGTNDARGGISPEVFRQEYQRLLDMIRGRINPVIVLVNLIYMHEEKYRDCAGWDKCDYDISEVFNLVIKQLAEKNHAIYADVYSSMSGVDWLVAEDHCHPNDLGHRIMANKIFEAIARNCSFTSLAMSPANSFDNFVQKYGNGPDK